MPLLRKIIIIIIIITIMFMIISLSPVNNSFFTISNSLHNYVKGTVNITIKELPYKGNVNTTFELKIDGNVVYTGSFTNNTNLNETLVYSWNSTSLGMKKDVKVEVIYYETVGGVLTKVSDGYEYVDVGMTLVEQIGELPPTAKSITNGGSPSRYSGFSVYANGVVDDKSGVQSVKFYVNNSSLSQVSWDNGLVTYNGSYDLSNDRWGSYVSISNFNNFVGEYYIYAKATDKAGNTGFLGSTKVLLDKTVPQFTSLSNDGSTTSNGKFKVYANGVTDDLSGVQKVRATAYPKFMYNTYQTKYVQASYDAVYAEEEFKWYDAVFDSVNNRWVISVDIANHKNILDTYYVMVWAYDNANNVLYCGRNVVQVQASRNGLVAEYLFNGNANDSSGSGNNGTAYGTVLTADRMGNANKAYLFNNSSIKLSFCPLEGGLATPKSFTISAWINSNSMPAANYGQAIFNQQNANLNSTNLSYTIFNNQYNRMSYGIYHPANNFGLGNTQIQINTWYHVVLVRNNNTWSHYLNGILESSGSSMLDYSDSSPITESFIGNAANSNTYWNFNGNIDNVRIYNRALTQNEITQLFNDKN
jgi:hypothetical protein